MVIREGVAGSQLVGYYTGAAGAEAEAEQNQRLRAALQAELPEYMVPAQLMRLAQMPLGPSGKLDTRALPEPVWQQREHVEPQTELQRRIAAIWSEVLGLPRVGLRDDFFELGGHSLLATRIVSRTRQACDVELPLRALFEASELEAFCEQVRAAQAAGRTDSHGAIRRIDREQPVPLSYSQQRMWFLWQLEPDSPAYNVGGLARLSGPLDVARFEAALQAWCSATRPCAPRSPASTACRYSAYMAMAACTWTGRTSPRSTATAASSTCRPSPTARRTGPSILRAGHCCGSAW